MDILSNTRAKVKPMLARQTFSEMASVVSLYLIVKRIKAEVIPAYVRAIKGKNCA